MIKKLYKLMNWPEIESVVYSECDDPHSILGPHVHNSQTIYQTYIPGAVKVRIQPEDSDKSYKMDMADESGFFAAMLPNRFGDYTYLAEFADGSVRKMADPYRFEQQIPTSFLEKFSNGDSENAYEYLGSHIRKIDGTEGTLFALWAPNAVRVSVIGGFNNWDGRMHQMRRLGSSGVFEIFIPGVKDGAEYEYEIKMRGGMLQKKADPYSFRQELRPGKSSIVCDIDNFSWTDGNWIKERERDKKTESPMSIYEVYPGDFCEPQVKGNELINFRSLAGKLIAHVKECGYTHVQLMPIMEHPLDASLGYETIGYYAPTARYGTPEDFQYFINECHKENIGVILDWTPAQFPADEYGLGNFGGSCLYENQDPRRGYRPQIGTKLFDYGKPQVTEYLLGNALYWIQKFHADGIRMDSVAVMLYLDYGKKNGEWTPNIYGGNENLEAIAFLRKCNDTIHERYRGTVTIAEESASWPKVTSPTEEEGLGFDFKWNNTAVADLMTYIETDPYFRSGCHEKLTESMVYCYSEKYIAGFSHEEAADFAGSLFDRMPGKKKDKFAGVRLCAAYLIAHPGKKMMFMGQESGQTGIWNEKKMIDWTLAKKTDNVKLMKCVADLNKVYRSYPELYAKDDLSDGFEWINCMSSEKCMVTFLRRGNSASELVVVAANFANAAQTLRIGVPEDGRYQIIFDSDSKIYGGAGTMQSSSVRARSGEYDGRSFSITAECGPLSVLMFKYYPYDEKEKSEIAFEKAEEEKQVVADAKNEAERLRSYQNQASEKAEAAEKSRLKAKKDAEKAGKQLEDAKNKVIILCEQSDREMAEARRKIEQAQRNAETVRQDAEKRIDSARAEVDEVQRHIDEANRLSDAEAVNRDSARKEAEDAAGKADDAEMRAQKADERRIQFESLAKRAVDAVSSVGKAVINVSKKAGRKK